MINFLNLGNKTPLSNINNSDNQNSGVGELIIYLKKTGILIPEIIPESDSI
jgi:hypothetical protein